MSFNFLVKLVHAEHDSLTCSNIVLKTLSRVSQNPFPQPRGELQVNDTPKKKISYKRIHFDKPPRRKKSDESEISKLLIITLSCKNCR